jgi:atypical dual specificity phosphatase
MVPPFGWLLPGILAGGPHPHRAGGVAALLPALRTAGIGGILSVFEAPLDTAEMHRLGLSYHFQVTPNFSSPPDLAAACTFIDATRAAGAATLVHCWMGWGRTGTVLAAYLLHSGAHRTAADAIAAVRAIYDDNAVESPEQETAVELFARGW